MRDSGAGRLKKVWRFLAVVGLMMVAVVAASVSASANALGIPDSEYDVLVALYNGTNGASWTDHTNWLTDSSPWYGVEVSGGHVVSLSLGSNHVSGQIPAVLGSLTYLEDLELGNNLLTGQIPTQLVNLMNLQWLGLSSNQLAGDIPSGLRRIPHLWGVQLEYNELSSGDPSLSTFLTRVDRGWENTQTVPPTKIWTSTSFPDNRVTVHWTPIMYTGPGGYYEVGISTWGGQPYTFSTQDRTISKSASSLTLAEHPLPNSTHYVVRTVTLASAHNQSTLTSALSDKYPHNPYFVRISVLLDPIHNLIPTNPVTVAGRVTAVSPTIRVNDGSGEIPVTGNITASLGQFVFVTGNWVVNTLSVPSDQIVW